MRKRLRTINDLANLVRGRRNDKGWTQDELARRAGVSRKWVNEFEAGKSTAPIDLVLRVVDALGAVLVIDSDPPSSDAEVDLDDLLRSHDATSRT